MAPRPNALCLSVAARLAHVSVSALRRAILAGTLASVPGSPLRVLLADVVARFPPASAPRSCPVCGATVVSDDTTCSRKCGAAHRYGHGTSRAGWLSYAEAGAQLGVSRQMVQKRLRNGKLPDLLPATVAALRAEPGVAGRRWDGDGKRLRPDDTGRRVSREKVRAAWAVLSLHPQLSARELQVACGFSSVSIAGAAIRVLRETGYVPGPPRKARARRVEVFFGTCVVRGPGA